MLAILAYLLGRSSGKYDGYIQSEVDQIRRLRLPPARRYYTTREIRNNRRFVIFALWCCTLGALHNSHVWPF